MDNIVATVSAITLIISTLTSPASATPTPSPLVEKAEERPYEPYVVRTGDSIARVAEEKLGDKEHWTTIWNDNPEIINPNIIEKGQELKIYKDVPKKPEDLKEDLANKLKVKAPPTQLASLSAKQGVASSAPSPTPGQDTTASSSVLSEDQMQLLGTCESGMTAARNSGNGYYGAFQFSYGTWKSMGTSYERADMAPLEVQKDAVQRLLQRSSIFTQFPGCAAKMRSQGLL